VGIPAGGFGVGVGPLCARSSWKRRSSRSRRSGDSGWVLSGGLLAFLLYFVAFVLVAVLPLLLVGGLLTHSRHGGRDRGLASAHRPLHRRLSRLGARPPSTPRVRPASTADSPRPATAMPRRLLVEAARHHRPRYRPGRNLRRRWDAAPLAARTRGEAANQRLHARWAGLDHRRKHPVVANAAIARERAGLVLVVGRPRRLTRPINARMMTRGCRQAPGSDPRATYEQSHCGAIDYARPLDKRSTPIRKSRPVVPTRAFQTDTRRYDTLDSQMTATHPTNEAAATTTVAARRFTLPT